MNLVNVLTVNSTPFVIYGAQVVAYGAYNAILHLCNRKPDCFVVSKLDNNPNEIEGMPVRTLDTISKEWLVIVCVTELLQKEIVSILKENDFTNIFILTQHEEYVLMARYFKSMRIFPIRDNVEKIKEVDLVVYEVRNHRDKLLSNPPLLQPFEYTLQAGAALTKEKIATYQDNIGDNISKKNMQYCEMTGTYWVWKNTDHTWTGIEHYRRHLLLKPELIDDEIDAILPLPYISYPCVLTQFRRFVSEAVVNALLDTLQTSHPEKFGRYLEILNGQYQYTYNLVCAKKKVFDEYCEWFFGITESIEKLGVTVPEIANSRALSYVAEVLTNLYFMSNQEKLKIIHTEKAIYV